MEAESDGSELHWYAQTGDIAAVRQLIEQGVDLDAFDELGKTPLHYAAENERLEVATLLLSSGANVNAHDERTIGNTPLAEVSGHCSLAMARLLVDAGADPTIPGWMQLTALDRARNRMRGEGPAVYELLTKRARGGDQSA